MGTLILNNYGRKNIRASLRKIVSSPSGVEYGGYINGVPIDQERNFRGKLARVAIDLAHLEDGHYLAIEASRSSARRLERFLLLKGGEVVKEYDSIDEVLDEIYPLPEDLPPLEGSPKQVAWANDIRKRFFRTSKFSEAAKQKAMLHTEASFWIRNRDKI